LLKAVNRLKRHVFDRPPSDHRRLLTGHRFR
jgi:hypothetical protein